jgi:signal transduction histidine kinase/CheY-like chemotaxis protein
MDLSRIIASCIALLSGIIFAIYPSAIPWPLMVVLCSLSIALAVFLFIDKKNSDEQQESVNHEQILAKEKTDYLAKVSHDLRTPLHGITGLLQTIQAEQLSPKVRRYIEQMHVSSNMLLNVISEVIDLSHFQENEIEVRSESFKLVNLCEDIIRMFTQTANAQDVDLQLQFDSRLLNDYVVSDQQRLYQVLNNLMGNAFKFTDKGRVSLWVIFRNRNIEEIEVRFIVADTGIGLEQKDADKVFDSFYQVKDSQDGRTQGSGLGLKITNELVSLLGGQIKLTSKRNFGSQFQFDLVFKRSSNNSGEPAYRFNEKLNAMVVLVSPKGTATESILLCLDNLNIHYEHFENCHQLKASSGLPRNKVLIIDFDTLDNFEQAENASQAYLKTSRYLLVSDKQIRDFSNWNLLFKPFLPSDILNLCISSKLLTPIVSVSDDKLDFVALIKEYVSDKPPLTLMIADDIELNQVVLSELLKQLGFVNFLFADNGQKAVEIATKEQVDVIFMDVNMPIMGGMKASKILREQSFTGNIIGVTAAVESELANEGAMHMDCMASKPITLDKLSKYLYETLAGENLDNNTKEALKQRLDKCAQNSSKELPICILIACSSEGTKAQLLNVLKLSSVYKISFVKAPSDIALALQKLPYHMLIVDTDLPNLDMSILTQELNSKRLQLPMVSLLNKSIQKAAEWTTLFTSIDKPLSHADIVEVIEQKLVRDAEIEHLSRKTKLHNKTASSNRAPLQ